MIEHSFLIEKRNVLNEMKINAMTLQEIRFLSIYLAKINARDVETREVIFPLDDVTKAMGLGRLNISQVQKSFESLLRKVVSIPDPKGGFSSFQLFKKCRLFKNECNEWAVSIDAHDEALPLMFDFKAKYFKYELWNALRLNSANQIRMYKILKQYEKIGERTLSIPDLKALLGIHQQEYPVWERFKTRVIISCQKALAENTDIIFQYVPIKKGRKFTEIKFIITKNENHVDQICFNEFLSLPPESEEAVMMDDSEESFTEKQRNMDFLSEAMNCEFTKEEVSVIFSIISTLPIPLVMNNVEFGRYHFLSQKYAELNLQHSKKPIKNRFAYFKKMIRSV